MRKLAVAAVLASTIAASPALARDGNWYVGLEGGLLKAKDTEIDYSVDEVTDNDAIRIDWSTGIDLDLLAGYDLGAVRVEGELGYKRVNEDELRVTPAIQVPVDLEDADARSTILSAMLNLLFDFGPAEGLSAYAGGGAGLARLKIKADLEPSTADFDGKDRSLAWQLIAGVRAPVSDAVDLGLKYRFFNSKFAFEDEDELGRDFDLDGRFRSHSLLASLTFNFGPSAPPPPAPIAAPPPPPPPPATQTCPDGTVVLATDVCPAPPPPPPPPPPPAPERG